MQRARFAGTSKQTVALQILVFNNRDEKLLLFDALFKSCQNCFGACVLDVARIRCNVLLHDDAVVDEHRVALRTNAESGAAQVNVEIQRTRKRRIGVGQQQNVVAKFRLLLPCCANPSFPPNKYK